MAWWFAKPTLGDWRSPVSESVIQRKSLTYLELKEINESSVAAGRNRNLYFANLPISDDGTIYPVVFDSVHNEREVRTGIALNAAGLTVWLDMSFDEFDSLQFFVLHRDLDTIDLDHDRGLRDLTDPFTGEMI
jgi:hypothetical protein